MKPAGMNIVQILWRQRKTFAYAGPDPVDSAALVFSVVGGAQLTASTASHTLSASLNLPCQNLLFLKVPDNPSSNPSV